MKYSKELRDLIEKAEKEIETLQLDVVAGKLDQRNLEAGLERLAEDLIKLRYFDHKADADDDSEVEQV